MCSEWKKKSEGNKSVTEHPPCLKRIRVPIRGGFGLDLSGHTGIKLPLGRIIEWLLHPMLLSFGKRTLLSFQKVLSKKLLEAQCLGRASTWREQPHRPFMEQNHEEVPFVLEKPSSDLFAKSSQHGLGSIQKLKVWFFMARRYWRSVVLWYSFVHTTPSCSWCWADRKSGLLVS